MRKPIPSTRSLAAEVAVDPSDLATQALLRVEEESFEQLLEWLDAPAAPNPELKRLMATTSPWEKPRG